VIELIKMVSKNPIIEVLREYTSFRYLYSSQVVSQLGSALHRIALMWLVLELTGSGLKMGTIMMVYSLPWVLFGVVAGTFVDRCDRRLLMIWADLARGVLVAVVPILALLDLLTYPTLIVISFLLSSVSTFYQPAKTALLPQVVDRADLMPANSAAQAAWQLTNIAGPVMGGVLIGVIGSSNVFWLDAVSYVISALLITRVRLLSGVSASEAAEAVSGDEQQAAAGLIGRVGGAWAELVGSVREGWEYLQTEKALLYVIGVSLFLNFVFAPTTILLPLLANNVLKVGASGYGILSAGLSAGMLLGAIGVGSLRRIKPSFVLWSMLALHGLLLSFVGYAGSLWGSTALFIGAGVTSAAINVLFFTIFQQMIPDDKLGRVNALMSTASMGAMPLAYALSGWIADLAPVPVLFAVQGVTAVLVGVSLSQVREFHRFDEVYDELQAQREMREAQKSVEHGFADTDVAETTVEN